MPFTPEELAEIAAADAEIQEEERRVWREKRSRKREKPPEKPKVPEIPEPPREKRAEKRARLQREALEYCRRVAEFKEGCRQAGVIRGKLWPGVERRENPVRIKTGKRALWCLARDYGANPPMMKHCTMIEGRNGYMLTWEGGRAYLFAVMGAPMLRIDREEVIVLTVQQLRERGMLHETKAEHEAWKKAKEEEMAARRKRAGLPG